MAELSFIGAVPSIKLFKILMSKTQPMTVSEHTTMLMYATIRIIFWCMSIAKKFKITINNVCFSHERMAG